MGLGYALYVRPIIGPLSLRRSVSLGHQQRRPGRAVIRAVLGTFARRPDLGEIELTCENINTVMPYVDLVLEVLCLLSRISPSSSID